MSDTVTILRVAAVQMESKNGLVEANLQHATPLVNRAAGMGARLILLPELMAAGYVYTAAIWNGAEPGGGPTVKWLQETSRKLGIWLGTSFLEADDEYFFNTFVLTMPDGREAGRVRKQTPAFSEAYFTRGHAGPHVLQTELGRVGVGICYENQLAYTPRTMCRESADLLLMPHSMPIMMQSFFFNRQQQER
jgi:N-carbamoylputrescine amidase